MTALRRAFGAVVCVWLAAHAPADAQEREEIVSYDVAVEVADGGSMDVTEEITARALGDNIRRGIYRDFPTSFPRSSGLGRIEAPFEVLEVRRDGAPEPYSVESIGGPLGRGGVRVRIGDPDRLLDHGVHTWTIRYRTSRWVSFGEAGDQLYWNVTGNGWDFPILGASARVTLPRAVDGAAVRLESWTGPEGSTANEATGSWEGAGALFTTDAPLSPREGLTVRLSFPKGTVVPPSADTQSEWFRLDWGGWIDAASLLGLILALYLFMWTRVGRDPESGPLVVRYEPPAGFSPAQLGYLRRRGTDDAQVTAALVDMAVKGTIRIEKDRREWTLHRLDAPLDALTDDERVLYRALMPGNRKLELTPGHSVTINKAVKAFRQTLTRELERTYFVLNRRWFAAGLGASMVGLAALAWRDRYSIPPEAWFMCLWLSFWSIGVGTLLTRVWQAWRAALAGAGFGAWAGALFITAFSTPFVAAEIVVGGLLTTRIPQYLVAAAAGLGALNVLFYHLLERPTLRGRGVLNELDGFQAFLDATDQDRLDRLNEPDRTPELFERYLPHAIALGVENRWAERFRDALAPAATGTTGVAIGGAALPSWYSGPAAAGFSGLASSLGGAFSSSLSAASSPPSSGGSGGGGGSSGGGGGGGGGGGW